MEAIPQELVGVKRTIPFYNAKDEDAALDISRIAYASTFPPGIGR